MNPEMERCKHYIQDYCNCIEKCEDGNFKSAFNKYHLGGETRTFNFPESTEPMIPLSEAFKFAQWVNNELWHFEEIEVDKWVKIDWDNECDIHKTTQELYKIFKESK